MRTRNRQLRHPAYDDPEVEELASEIDERLVALERDPKTNPREEMIWGLQPKFDNARARAVEYAPVVGVQYFGWGPRYLLTKDHAKKYLGRLKRGFTGRHDE